MEPISIILIVLGIALLIGSCFFTKEDKSELEYDELIKRLAKRELTEEETERLRETVDRIVSEKTEEVILKTDDYLSQVANEKIMSVDEFSKQILERLDKNNSDVMFLYNMVTETKEELKTEIANAKKAQEALERSVEKKIGDGKEIKVEEKKKPVAPKQTPSLKTEPVKKASGKAETPEPKKTDDIVALLAATMTMETDVETDGDMPKEKILELYKSGKSIREISRELGMGQGEVKLVIDLYGL
ncbi:MAG: helix-turn-helix domain-containing protein [Lachnospiraceae bacterium]|nr:helix-turn-helix domain-containing protein [Lachnospiraceae bacterium]